MKFKLHSATLRKLKRQFRVLAVRGSPIFNLKVENLLRNHKEVYFVRGWLEWKIFLHLHALSS